MNILIGKKLMSKNLHKAIVQYWDDSFSSPNVVFDFSETEWVSGSEILFIVGWINFLVEQNNVVVSIHLPTSDGLKSGSHTYSRRKYLQAKLLSDWKILKHIPASVNIVSGGYPATEIVSNSRNEIVKIPLIEYKPNSFDELYFQHYNKQNIDIYKGYKALLETANLSYLDSDYLNYSIVKELFSNVCIHSGLNIKVNSCYYSISINKKISEERINDLVLKERISELSELEKPFFMKNDAYRNIDYVELNFQDFGDGIVSSLKERYKEDLEQGNLQKYFGEEYQNHLEANLDSQILHYALLLFTSKYEINKKFEIHDYIPRGLFIIRELTEKYRGYFEIFSGNGAVGVSSFEGAPQIKFANKNNKKALFRGTRIRIVFPSIDSGKSQDVEVKNSSSLMSTPPKFQFINLLSYFSKVEEIVARKKNQGVTSHILKTSLFFEKISKQMVKFPKNSIICFDFAGFDKDTKDIFAKFIYFISHTPSNSSYRIILFNIAIPKLNTLFITKNYKDKGRGFYPYPIPVIFPNLYIEWLGVEDDDLEDKLNNLWKGDDNFDSPKDLDVSRYSSSIINITKGDGSEKLSINLPSFEDTVETINSWISTFLIDEIENSQIRFVNLQNENHNYNKVLRKKDNVVYHTSYGNYQNSYLSFNDKLYVKSYTRMLASYLIFKNYNVVNYNKHNQLYPPIDKTNKILSVTLSSQFLAVEVKKILKDLFPENDAEIIALSNYYNFYKERRFKDIEKGDKVLVINDIVSTGRLTETIFDSLEKIEAKPIGCLVISDLRGENREKEQFDYPIISICDYSIERMIEKPEGHNVQWINPILNSPVTIEKEKNQLSSLLTKEQFLEFIDDEDIMIGNMKNNSHNLLYFLNTHNLLSKDLKNGFKLLKLILSKLKEKKKVTNLNELETIVKGLNIISKNVEAPRKKSELQKITNRIRKFNTVEIFSDYNVDVVFYPFLSEISIIEEDLNLFESLELNRQGTLIFPVPRIQTERGWRFTFPPKFLNILTSKRNPTVLVIDDGSSTGSTLMQMIDSIAFLSVKSIDALSIFGRLEDFQKELFIRLKSIRVKNKVVPLNIYFAVHMNLAVYNDQENPFLQEAREISELRKKLKKDSGDNFEDYLDEMYLSLTKVKNPKDTPKVYPIFEEISQKSMLLIRDKIGLFDSYRFYSEDIPDEGDFGSFVKKDKDILELLSVLNLEPALYKTIMRLLPPSYIIELINACYKFVLTKKYNDENQIIFFIKALYYLNSKDFIKSSNLIKLTDILEGKNVSSKVYQYLCLLLFLVGFEVKNIEDVIALRGFPSNIFDWLNHMEENHKDLFIREFRFFSEEFTKLQQEKIGTSSGAVNVYLRLSYYYQKTTHYEGRHEGKLLQSQISILVTEIVNVLTLAEDEKPEEIVLRKQRFNDALEKYNAQYFHEYKEYSYIKKILTSLNNYGSKNLDFNPQKLFDIINILETHLKNNKDTTSYFNKLRTSLREYESQLLFSSSSFNKFIRNQESNLEITWNECEKQFSHREGYKYPELRTNLNYNVLVNGYILFLTFQNLIQNKEEYAKESGWTISCTHIKNDKLEMRIRQEMNFVEGGTGNSYSSIREFLKLNGTFYRRINKNPFILKIVFPLKTIL